MKVTTCFVALALAALLAPAALGQADGDDVAAVLDAMLDGARAGDQEALGDRLHDSAIFCVDPDRGVQNKDEIVAMTAAEPMPEAFEFGEWEVELLGDIALAIAPVTLPAGAGPQLDSLAMGAVLLLADGDWQVLAAAFLLTDLENEDLPAVMQAHFDGMAAALPGFLQKLEQSATAADFEALAELCAPEVVFVGPMAPGGPIEVATIDEVAELAEQLGDVSMEPVVPSDEELLMGFGCAALSINMNVTVGDADPVLMREMMIAVFVPGENKWQIVMAIEAPLE